MAKFDYKVPGTNITIEKGTMVQVPVFAIHNDPEIYPNPNVWDPDRMAPEEMKKRHLFSFTPFGMGPHQCIGFRLGLLTGKTTLVKTILKYEFELDRQKTPDKLTYNPKRLFMTTEGTDDIYVKFNKIKA
jgi:cytochrome P450 family 6